LEKAWSTQSVLSGLGEELQEAVKRVCAEGVSRFVRSSSCVEGRNGQLSLHHHGCHALSPGKLKALTVIPQLPHRACRWEYGGRTVLWSEASQPVRGSVGVVSGAAPACQTESKTGKGGSLTLISLFKSVIKAEMANEGCRTFR